MSQLEACQYETHICAGFKHYTWLYLDTHPQKSWWETGLTGERGRIEQRAAKISLFRLADKRNPAEVFGRSKLTSLSPRITYPPSSRRVFELTATIACRSCGRFMGDWHSQMSIRYQDLRKPQSRPVTSAMRRMLLPSGWVVRLSGNPFSTPPWHSGRRCCWPGRPIPLPPCQH